MNFEEFIIKVTESEELGEILSKASSPDEAYEIAVNAGLDMPKEDFIDAMNKLNDACTEMNTDDIDAIVGGASTAAIITAAASTVGAAASAAATAASAAGAAA